MLLRQSIFRANRGISRLFVRNSSVTARVPETETKSCEKTPVTLSLQINNPNENSKWPMFQVMDLDGHVWKDGVKVEVSKEETIKMYNYMVRVQAMDDVLYNAQRQGRISFYMQCAGEEGTLIGSASALKPQDVIFAQYREVGVLMWRGFTVQQCADQCFSNVADVGKGRQMPVHYGSKEANFQTISSPLGTQIPQAAGAAYALKQSTKDAIAVCYFGEGAASEGDFHAGMNFATTLEVPMIFFCRNNGYAISTPTKDQFRGDGIISRAVGYGMRAIRVDGNDLWAVRAATAEARRIALEHSCPVLIEAMSYRRGHHSTSDDSTRYRESTEINQWAEQCPVKRFRKYMEHQGWWDEDQEKALREKERKDVLIALETAEKRPKPDISEIFTDVYDQKIPILVEQEAELHNHMAKYPEHYHSVGH